MTPGHLPPKILLVIPPDDHRARLVASLEKRGFDVACADSTATCIHVVRDTAPSVIVMDRVLPDGDGWELVRVLKSLSSTRDAIVIAVTADDARRHVEQALLIGCEAMLVKPFDADVLVQHVERLLGRDARDPTKAKIG